MTDLYLKNMTSLDKVFIDKLNPANEYSYASSLQGEEFSYQIAFWASERIYINVNMESDLENEIRLFQVENVPSAFPAYPDRNDENYLSTRPGLFPDILFPVQNGSELVAHQSYRSLWISVKATDITKPGTHQIKVTFENKELQIQKSSVFNLHIINAVMPAQKLIYTQWLHTDCIMTHYGLEVFLEEYWQMTRKFIESAVEHGINAILTPLFTPPLDTQMGSDRPTIQLVGVIKTVNQYAFDFSKLKQWVDMCVESGVSYFEMSHLFTQWGAEFTPKILALENGSLKRIFGWDVRADSVEYKNFMAQFLPQLVRFLKEEQIEKKTFFHISDEPHGEVHLEQYKKAKELVFEYINDFKIVDALSDFQFYQAGLVENPIAAIDAIEPFLKNKVKGLWAYYCCGQAVDVSNRFLSMPSARNRIIGFQLYKYDIVGFLHWGYNFYYSHFSKKYLNPYFVTDSDGAFPSGDPFSVYPGEDGPVPSLRLKVFHEALQDIRALELLEKWIGKDAVIELLEENLNSLITFDHYPKDLQYILQTREKINRKIEELMHTD